MKDDGSGRKIIVHAAIAGLMSRITGAGFASSAVGAGLNEALINNLKVLDPTLAQGVSALYWSSCSESGQRECCGWRISKERPSSRLTYNN